MPYQNCEKHKVRWNDEETDSCPICKHGKPGMNQGDPKRRSLSSPIDDSISAAQIRNQIKRQMEEASKKYNTPQEFIKSLSPDVFSDNRGAEFVDQRMRASVTLRFIYKLSYSAIGRLLGKDHTTILNHIWRYKRLYGGDNT